jgi:hypothetical protein
VAYVCLSEYGADRACWARPVGQVRLPTRRRFCGNGEVTDPAAARLCAPRARRRPHRERGRIPSGNADGLVLSPRSPRQRRGHLDQGPTSRSVLRRRLVRKTGSCCVRGRKVLYWTWRSRIILWPEFCRYSQYYPATDPELSHSFYHYGLPAGSTSNGRAQTTVALRHLSYVESLVSGSGVSGQYETAQLVYYDPSGNVSKTQKVYAGQLISSLTETISYDPFDGYSILSRALSDGATTMTTSYAWTSSAHTTALDAWSLSPSSPSPEAWSQARLGPSNT